MKSEMVKFFSLQRQIFGICPHCSDFFRLADCNIYLKRKPVADWMDGINKRIERLIVLDEKLKEEKEELWQKAREKGRRRAQKVIKRIDPVFAPRKLDFGVASTLLTKEFYGPKR